MLAGGADIDPGSYGDPRHPKTTNTRPDRDARGDRPGPARAGARPAGPGHLPRDAADQRRARRDPDPAPARMTSVTPTTAAPWAPSTTPTTTCACAPGSLAARGVRRAACTRRSPTTTRRSTPWARASSASGWSVLDDLVEAIEMPEAVVVPGRAVAPGGRSAVAGRAVVRARSRADSGLNCEQTAAVASSARRPRLRSLRVAALDPPGRGLLTGQR